MVSMMQVWLGKRPRKDLDQQKEKKIRFRESKKKGKKNATEVWSMTSWLSLPFHLSPPSPRPSQRASYCHTGT